MKLLHVIGTLDPSYGGPVTCLAPLSSGLRAEGHESSVVTLDGPASPWLASWPAPVFALGPSRGRYRYNSRIGPWLRETLPAFDAAIVHGVWQHQSLAVHGAAERSGTPYFLYPHGALDPWFRRRYPAKHVKKQAYWLLAEGRVMRDAAAVVFTSQEEFRLARGSFWPFRAHAEIVSLGIDDPEPEYADQENAFLDAYPQLQGSRILLFLSRLHPKKGCDLLVRAFARFSQRDESLRLVMAGPDEIGWGAELARIAGEQGVTDRILWTGMLSGARKWGAYRAAEAFVLPSHSENFGIVIAEALACGVPVLTTRRVNIWREITDSGCGYVEDDTATGVDALLWRWLATERQELRDMGQRGRQCFRNRFESRRAAVDLAEVLRLGLTGGLS